MNGINVSAAVGQPPAGIEYPSSDGEPLAETEVHLMVIFNVIAMLRQHFGMPTQSRGHGTRMH